jgi:hypothetical protein
MTPKGFYKYGTMIWSVYLLSDIISLGWRHGIFSGVMASYLGYRWWKNRKDDDWTDKGKRPKKRKKSLFKSAKFRPGFKPAILKN